jgi:hypothetical protein
MIFRNNRNFENLPAFIYIANPQPLYTLWNSRSLKYLAPEPLEAHTTKKKVVEDDLSAGELYVCERRMRILKAKSKANNWRCLIKLLRVRVLDVRKEEESEKQVEVEEAFFIRC